jgi:gliding motility-associated protein GldM
VPRPNSATISADKMNVVYRGVDNPMTISFAGVSSDKVKASAPGLSSTGKPGAFMMKPGSGTETTIVVTATLPDGKPVSDKKIFRIKNIPAPVGAIGGEINSTKGAKSRLAVSEISAKMPPDFDFQLNIKVTQFIFKVQGQAAVIVNGNRVNSQCVAAMARASRGDVITITDIKTVIPDNPRLLTSKCSPVIYELL